MPTASSKRQDVFINCPFDDQYKPILNAVIFAVVRCGFQPRSALEASDTAEVRIDKITRIIRDSRFGIHDISRTELDPSNGLPRFNMPFELGLFLGARFYGERPQRQKTCLVLDREPYRYQKYISDIAGQDIAAHGDDPEKAMVAVRNYLNDHNGRRPLPSGRVLAEAYASFNQALPAICATLELEPSALQYQDYVYIVSDFVSDDGPAR